MKDSDFKKQLFSECLDNLASKGSSAAGTGGTQPTDTQQLKAEIAALANEIERRTKDQVSISPSMVVDRLRQLSAV
jgi:hypothetical protein